jgi:PAS domain S-box-containing protein
MNQFSGHSESYPDYAMALEAGHPVKTYLDESQYIRSLLRDIENTDALHDPQKFINLFNELSGVEKRYARKENQLFPYLEKYGWNGPSQGMWAFHDAIRDLMREVRKKIEARSHDDLNHDIRRIADEMRHLMAVEEGRLFPNALRMLNDDDWREMRAGESEIGWMLKINHDAETGAEVSQDTTQNHESLPSAHAADSRLRLDEGFMTPEQVNLLLKVLPVDLTYVDENDRVIFYNRGEERVFPRSAGVIGRQVRFCHPPKSVDTVLKILEAFKSGEKSEAEFWIKYRGRVVHIRYFAVRDREKRYKGVIEMTQDITDIQKLEGEQRLLDWDNVAQS